jgi:hypothetical protein
LARFIPSSRARPVLEEDRMAASPRSYRNIEEFEREEIRPSYRIGFSVDDLEESSFESELNFEVERDSFELDSVEDAEEDDDDDDVEEPVVEEDAEML